MWKATERRVARILGGVRIPITGRTGPDIVHEEIAIEVKERATLPAWLEKAFEQARDGAKPRVVVLHRKGRRWREDVVLMRLGDFAELMARCNGQGGE